MRRVAPHTVWQTVCMKKLGVVVCLLFFASACAGSESEELTQTCAELDALKGQVAGSVGLMGTHQTPTTVASSFGTLLTSPELLNPPSYPSSLDIDEELTGAEAFEELTSVERREWIRTDLLIGLPWRDAEEMAQDAGWSTKVIFAVEGEPVIMTLDLSLSRLRLVVFGGEEVGTVADVVNS